MPLDYKTWHVLVDTPELEMKVKLQRAGHILGSVYVEVSLHYKEQQYKERLVFSGDMGAPWSPILSASRSPYQYDWLVLESTYGDRLHDSRKDRAERLRLTIERALAP